MNDINYDAEFVKLVARLHGARQQKYGATLPSTTAETSPKSAYVYKKLLLHACCAPCSTYCLTQVLPHFDVTLYYANDNITCREEWDKRLGELTKLVDIVNSGKFVVATPLPLKLVVQPFAPQRYYDMASGFEAEKEGGTRCARCFTLRLSDTRDFALSNGFDYFGTTLTVSPYKNSKLLNTIGKSLQADSLTWLPSDFKKRNGYDQSIQLSEKYALYRQHYCGCDFSKNNI